jgi:hypothetical protein
MFMKYFKPSPVLDPLERLAKSELATSTRPDDIIAACLVESFLKDHSEWTATGMEVPPTIPFGVWSKNVKGNGFRLEHPTKGDLYFDMDMRRVTKDRYNSITGGIVYVDKVRFKPVDKPAVTFHPALGDILVKKWNEISKSIGELNATAARAEAEMKENEVKWSVAEEFLGMKRDKNGVLRSIRQVPKPRKPRRPKVLAEPIPADPWV